MKKYLLSPNLWASVAIIAICVAIWIVLKRLTKKHLNKNKIKGKKVGNTHFIITLVKYVITIFAVITVLQINGINVTSLVTGLGIAGVVVGFALQDFLKDVIMGTNIVWDGFFSVGDVVKYNNVVGKVTYFNIKVTKIQDIDNGNIVIISNRNISEIQRISDWVDIVIPTSYGENAEEMRAVCNEICEKIGRIPKVKKCEFLGTDEFAESSINYRLRLHCQPEKRNIMRRTALGVVQDTLAEKKITIPFNQLDVHLDK